MEDAIVGDKVWDFVYGWGQVIKINPLDNYPLIVKFEDSSVTYTYSGSEFKGYRQTLFWDEVKFEIPERPKPKFKIGDWVVDGTIIIQILSEACVPESYKLWQPQEGEWCAFYDDDNDYLVAKFDKSIESKHYPQGRGWFGNIAPLELIETLKGD